MDPAGWRRSCCCLGWDGRSPWILLLTRRSVALFLWCSGGEGRGARMGQVTKGEFSPVLQMGLRPETHSLACYLGR